MSRSKRAHIAILILINFLLLHYIVSSIPLRIDVTEENMFSLSKNTKTLLSKIEDPVTLDFYYSKSAKDLPIRFKNFANRVEQMIKQYANAGGGKIRLNIIDPQPDTPEEENAIAAGLHGQSLPSGVTVFLGLVATQADNEKSIAFFDWNKEGFLEYDLSRLIFETQLLAKPRLGLLTSLPLQAPPYPMMPGQPPQEDQYVVQQWESVFEVESIEPTAIELPNSLDILAIINPPATLSDSLLYEIDQHILKGKPVFIAVDPSSRTIKQQSQQSQMGMMGMGQPSPDSSTSFPKLFDAWGISYDSMQAVGDPNLAYSQANFIQPSWLVFRDTNINKDFMPTADVSASLLLETGAFKLEEDSGLELTPVMTTTSGAGQVSSMILDYTQQGALLRQIEAGDEELVVAGLLNGEFKTAFPDGEPAAPDRDEDSEEATGEEEAEHLESGQSSVFIIADTDWLMDQFSIRRLNFLGMNTYQPLNDNQTLASNVMNFLGGSRDLIGLQGKGTQDRSFEVVQQMEVKAQQAFQEKLQQVEDQLSGIQQEIQKIASQQEGSGLIVATPELAEALKKHREEEAKLRGERRDIRRELRKDINSLKWKLIFVNVGLPPLALVAFGLFFFRSRRQQSL